MNPPFVRSVNSNLLFGSLPRWRQEMQRELARRMRGTRGNVVQASTTAGLGSVFAAIGDRHLKPNGRLALVLPAAVTTGGAWERTRALLDNGYQLEAIVASHDATRWAFSENTDLSEILLVAKKLGRNESRDSTAGSTCTFISLWRNPDATADSLSLGESLSTLRAAPIGTPEDATHGIASIEIGTQKWGEALTIPLGELRGQPWLGCAFAQTELTRANWHLRRGHLALPAASRFETVPLCRLDQLGVLGPDGRDIHDGFVHSHARTSYAAFWNHDADSVLTIRQDPNRYLSPRNRPAAGRPNRPANLLWPKAAQLMVAVRLRFNTHRLTAIRVGTAALSNVWYPVSLSAPNESHEKALLLWLNSTLGVLLLAGHRVPTQGAWVQFKKPTWNPMPVLNVAALTAAQLRALSAAYDDIATREIGPISNMEVDPIRAEIDDAISHALGLSSLAPIRVLLAQEPVISNRPLGVADIAAGAEETPEQFELLLPEHVAG